MSLMRITQLRTERDLTQKELANEIGLNHSVLSRIETGERPARDDELLKIAEFFDVSVDYLLGKETKGQQNAIKIPIYASVAAGNPILANDEVIDYEEIPKSWESQGEFFGVKVKGDSMLPDFKEGDTLLVKKQNDIDNKDLAIVLVNGYEATFKQVQKLKDGIMLIGFNSSVYTPEFFSREEIEELPVTIIGKVIELRRAF